MNRLAKAALAFATSTMLGVSMLGCTATPGAAATESASESAGSDAAATEAATSEASSTKGIKGDRNKNDASQSSEESAGTLSAAGIAAPDKTDLKNKDLTDTWGADSAQITLNGASASSNAAGVRIDGAVVTISSEGTYVLSGTLDNGRIVVDAGNADDVQIVLNGADITSNDGAAIHALNADKTILTIAEGTENSVTDGVTYADTSDDAPNAAIYADCDLSINGKGTLNVTGNNNNGIGTKDDLKIANGTISVTAANNALKGKDSVQIADGTFSLTAGGDAIQSDKDDDVEKGFVVIDGGSFTINAANDAIQAEMGMTINGGTFDVTTNEGADNASQKTTSNRFGGGGFTRPEMDGSFGERPDGDEAFGGTRGSFGGGRGHGGRGRMNEAASSDGTQQGQSAEDAAATDVQPVNVQLAAPSESTEPASDDAAADEQEPAQSDAAASTESTAESRRHKPQSTDETGAASSADPSASTKPSRPSGTTAGSSSSTSSSDSCKGLKANGILTINGGTFSLNCADDAVHSNDAVNLNGGSFTISSGDDAVHADGDLRVKTDVKIEKSYEGLEGGNVYIEGGNIDIASSDDAVNAANDNRAASCVIEVTGGTVNAVGGGDGFDSNGDIKVSGGDITMLIKSSADNCAFDAERNFTVTGGSLIYGGTGTGAGPGSGSSQSYVFARGSFSSGTEVSLRSNGQTLISFVPSIDCSSLSFSVPSIKSGDTYEVYQADTLVATATAGQGSSGMAGGGMGGMRPDWGQSADGTTPDGFDPGTRPQRPGSDGTTDGTAPDGAAMPDGSEFDPGMRPDWGQNADGTTPDGFDPGTRPQRPGSGGAPDAVTSPTMEG